VGALFGNAVSILIGNVVDGVQTATILSLKMEYVSDTIANCEFVIEGDSREIKKQAGLLQALVPKYIYVTAKMQVQITEYGIEVLSSSLIVKSIGLFSTETILNFIYTIFPLFGGPVEVNSLEDINVYMQGYIPLFLNPWLAHLKGQFSFTTAGGMLFTPAP